METNIKELLTILNRRTERLQEELELRAPKLVIKTELRLIKDACDKLLEKFDKNSKKL